VSFLRELPRQAAFRYAPDPAQREALFSSALQGLTAAVYFDISVITEIKE
jgi:hypothetical protein